MKRFLVAAMLLLSGVVAAQADTTNWTAAHPPATNSQLHAAARVCDLQVGDPVGVPTSAAYKKCMRGQGWIYNGTTRDSNWVNRRGMDCHPILNGGGSECDSTW